MKKAVSFAVFVVIFLITNQNKEKVESIDTEILIETLKQVGLPLLTIETIDGQLPTYQKIIRPEGCKGHSIVNAIKVPGRLRISNGDSLLYDSGDYNVGSSGITFRIRGNTSAYYGVKKPYKIKLQKKADLLLRGNDSVFADKNWLLIKDASLKFLIGFKVNELLQLQWTPAFRYVNVVINGRYAGVYMLVESVSRNKKCRLNVDKQGFIFEYDAYWWKEQLYEKSTLGRWPMNYTIKYPDTNDITHEQLDYFSQMIRQMEQSLKNGNYSDYIDIESFARWILAHDIIGGSDSNGSNYYFTKYDSTNQSKVMMANLWDFDHVFYREDKWDGCHNIGCFHWLFNNRNNEFVEMYKSIWKSISDTVFDEIISYLDDFASSEESVALSKSIEFDNKKYGTKNDVDASIEIAKNWFVTRQKWLALAIPAIKSTHQIAVETIGCGTINVADFAKEGETVGWCAVADDGYEFVAATIDDVDLTDSTFVMPTHNVLIKATFQNLDSCAVH